MGDQHLASAGLFPQFRGSSLPGVLVSRNRNRNETTTMNHILTRLVRRELLLAAACALALLSTAHAQFTLISLPNLPTTTSFPSFQPDALPDGRLVYGSKNLLSEQNSFGGSSFSSYANAQNW